MKPSMLAALLSVLLVSCAAPIGTPALASHNGAAVALAPRVAYKLLYSFSGYPGGEAPTGLTPFRNAIYGTTVDGGTHTFGTVFRRNSSGVATLYNFKGGSDGASPSGAMLALDGKLYGETEYGGSSGDGAIFEIGATGTERIVYSFKGGTDGATPILGTLVDAGGTLYGTTSAGGDSECSVQNSVGCGIVFSVTPSGTEKVLYRFSGKPDGAIPIGSLIDLNGTLYGTTSFGGAHNAGSVFKMSASGTERILYSFKGFPDGQNPYAGVTESGGTLYGTTAFGGAYDDSGTVFSVSASGTERVLHSFEGYPDGADPFASLIVVDGLLYGTTQFGGKSGDDCTGHGVPGCGIVFSITTAGSQKVIYRFRGEPDGSNPWASLIYQSGEFYGATVSGGADDEGSVFSLTSPANRAR